MSTVHSAARMEEGYPGAEEHAHPRVGTYLRVAILLGVLTVLEVWAYTIESFGWIVVPILLILAGTKFLTVVSFYMHLRFDNRLFSYVFGFGLLVAASIVTALLFLFGQYPLPIHAGSAPLH